MKNNISTKKLISNMDKLKLFSFAFIFLFSISFIVALDDLGTYKQSEDIRIRQTCASCSYINLTISFPNSTLAVTNAGMTSAGAGVWYYDFQDTDVVGRYDVVGVGDLNSIATSFATYLVVTRSGTETPDGMPTLQGILAIIIFGVAWFMLFMSDKFKEVGPKIFFLLLGFIFIIGSMITIFQILLDNNATTGLSTTLTALITVVLTVFFIVFLFVMIRQTIVALDYLKVKKGKKWTGGKRMPGYGPREIGF